MTLLSIFYVKATSNSIKLTYLDVYNIWILNLSAEPSHTSQNKMSFSSIENKRLIWSSLVESGYFKGFPASQKDIVKRVLDSVVHEASQTPAISGASTIEKNKYVVKQMSMYRDLWTQDGTITPTSFDQNTKKDNQFHNQRIETGYSGVRGAGYTPQVTAEELREQRESAFNHSLRAKQEEMEGYLNGSRPQNIDFSDKTQDQRIGGDMERLVAEAEAERRRQMDALFSGGINNVKDAEKWVNGGRPLKIDNSETLPIESHTIVSPRRVRFSDESLSNIRGKERDREHNTEDRSDIFARLKKRPLETRSPSPTPRLRMSSPTPQPVSDEVLAEMKSMRSQMTKMEKDIENLLTIIRTMFSNTNRPENTSDGFVFSAYHEDKATESKTVPDTTD